MILEIVVGSHSQEKFLGTTNALLAVGPKVFKLYQENMDSGENCQPLEGQTRRGARTRAIGAQKTRPGSWGLGIENGAFLGNGVWRDAADIVLVDPNGREYEARTEYVVLPAEAVEEALAIGFFNTTVGAVMAERYGCSSSDPHSFLTDGKKSRAQFLEEALIKLFDQVFNGKKEVTVSRVHKVQIGSRTLELPIREVAPGISVALFNLLGDWELTEFLGQQLAAKLMPPVDVLIMPDGKAQALLHVIGRELKLPTVVARKEKKPYMGDCVSVQVKSITTDRVQTLYISVSDAEMLRGKHVVIVDDVVSTGGTLDAMKQLLEKVGAIYERTLAVFTEGPDVRPDVISLGNLPLF
ncbi:MAG: DUF84 family protein [Patescibacteria group bacterium]|jgi:adenine phosphoribosyltransferase